jgi:glycogen(starch) synthase
MKLLIYSHFFSPSIGGVESFVMSLARGLAQHHSSEKSAAFEIILVTQTPAANFDDSTLPFRVIRRPGANHFRQLIREADVVHIAGAALSPIVWSLLAAKPVVIEHHAFQAVCPTGQLFQEPQNIPCPDHFMAGRYTNCLRCSESPQPVRSLRLLLLTFVRRFLCARVTLNIAPTAWLASLLRLPRTEVIPHGLETGEAVLPVSRLQEKPVLLFVGRLVSTKGVRVLLLAAKLLADRGYAFDLLIVGDGPERASLEKQSQASGLTSQVRFLGRLSEQELRGYFSIASIVVVPSLAGEVFGLVVAENMLRGIPIVASDLGAFAEILGGTGRVFKPGDADSLAHQIADVLENPVEASRLAATARHRVLDFFSLRRMIEAHAAAYRRVCAKMGR